MYEFGEFRLDATRRLLFRSDGDPVVLTPKALDTLLYLVERPGQVLTKEELLSALWPDTIVEESNLSQNVYTLRRALGEGRGEHRYIATVPGRGYQFVANVTKVARSETPKTDTAAKRPAVLAAIMGAVFVIAVAVFVIFGERNTADGASTTIAVLPFKPLVVAIRDEALELGMADTLIGKLGSIRQLRVRPLAAVRRFGSPDQDPAAAGRELGADIVLDGHIQRDAERIRITARLVRVSDDRQLWAGRFDENFTDIFSIQDAISERVVKQLSLRLTGEQWDRLVRKSTTDAKAYEQYLKGRFYVNIAQPQRAIEAFQEAVNRDENFALAHAGLADIFSRLPIAADVPARQAMPRAKQAALKALEIDSGLAEAHTALGWIKFYFDWDWAGSESAFQKALDINPDDFSAHLGYAHLLSNTGRHVEALREVDEAMKLDPRSPIANALKAQFFLHAGQSSEAIEHATRTLEISPTFWIALIQLGRAYERERRYEEAIRALQKARQSGGTTASSSFLGATLAAGGRTQDARAVLRDLQELSKSAHVPPYNIALVHAALGDVDNALLHLDRAHKEKDVQLVFLGIEPAWALLRNDRRFIALLEQMKLRRPAAETASAVSR